MSRKARVLIVEDDRVLRRAVEVMLSQHGFAVTTAADGDEGLRLVAAQHPDIVLLDLLMPKRSGTEVLRALKADPATSAIPVVILSNSSRADYKDTALALGAAEFHLKATLSLKDLAVRVEALVAGRTPDANAPPPTPAAGGAPPVDVRALLDRFGGDAALAAEIVAECRADLPARLAALGAAVASRSAAAIERAAHNVQGTLLLVGASRAAALASRIELSGEGAAPEDIAATLKALEREVAEVDAFLDAASRGEAS